MVMIFSMIQKKPIQQWQMSSQHLKEQNYLHPLIQSMTAT